MVLLGLVVSPALALRRLSPAIDLRLSLGYWAVVSVVTYAMHAWDKKPARAHGQREPDKTLHFFALAGGWPGAYLAQRRLRHKCSKLSYQIGFWLIVPLHVCAATDYLLDWRVTQGVQRLVQHISAKLK